MADDRIAFKTRIHLNNVQAKWMRSNCHAARIAYNYAIDKLRNRVEGDPFPKPPDVRKRWTAERDTLHPWMKRERMVLAGTNDAIAVRYKAALNNWKASGWRADKAPTFQGKSRRLSVTWSYSTFSRRRVNGRIVELPQKQGTARLAEPIPYEGDIKQTTISFDGVHWNVAFLIAAAPRKREPAPEGTATGVDLGIARFATLSNGEYYPPVPGYEEEHAKQIKLQRQLSRMEGPVKKQKRASKNWMKQQRKLAKQTRRLANLRRNYIEHLSRDLARDYRFVALEDLRVDNMTSSAKGDAENPGKNVKAKAGLNRSLLNHAFGMTRTRIEAKVASASGETVVVNPCNTSRTCPSCGHTAAENRQTQAKFECVDCGYVENADVVAAQNILHRAVAR